MPTTTGTSPAGIAKPSAAGCATFPAGSPPISPCPSSTAPASPSTAPNCPPLPSSNPTNVGRSGTSTNCTADRVSPHILAPTPTTFGGQVGPLTSATKTRAAPTRAPLSPIVPPLTPPRVSSTPSAPWAPRKPRIKASTWPRLQSPPSPTPCRLLFGVSASGPMPTLEKGQSGNSYPKEAQAAPRTAPQIQPGRVTGNGKGRTGLPAMVKLERSQSPFLLAQPKIAASRHDRHKATTDKETTLTAAATGSSDADEATAALARMTIRDNGPSTSNNHGRATSTAASPSTSRTTNSTNSPASSRSTSPTWSTSSSSAPSPNLPNASLPGVKPKVYTPRMRSRVAAPWQIVENESDDEDEDEEEDVDEDPFCRGSKPRVLWFGFEKTNVGVADRGLNEKCGVSKKESKLPGDDWWLSRSGPRRDDTHRSKVADTTHQSKAADTTGHKSTA